MFCFVDGKLESKMTCCHFKIVIEVTFNCKIHRVEMSIPGLQAMFKGLFLGESSYVNQIDIDNIHFVLKKPLLTPEPLTPLIWILTN